jgi:hypothetical protein
MYPGVIVSPFVNTTISPTINLISQAGDLYVKMPETLLLPLDYS